MRLQIQRHWPVLLACCLLIISGLSLLNFYKYQLNPDAVASMSLADKYQHGDIRHAINGYWGPLLPWLLALVSPIISNQIIAAKLLALLAGVLVLIIFDRILSMYAVSQKRRLFVFLPLVPLLLDWALPQPISSDLLFVATASFMALRGLCFLRSPVLANAFWFGLSGALLYAAKPFGFFFALVVYACAGLVAWRTKSDAKLLEWPRLRPLFLSCAVFLLISTPWVAALSVKYHHPAIATSTTLNHALVGPKHPQNPYETSIIPPSNSTAISSWEDPSHYVLPDWHSFDSFYNFYYTIGLILSNIYASLVFTNIATTLGASILVALVFWRCLAILRSEGKLQDYDYLLLLCVLIILAYSPILVLTRYIYLAIALLPLLAVLAFQIAKLKQKFSTYRVTIWLLVLVVTATLYPTITDLHAAKYTGRSYYLEAQEISPYIPVGSAVAANTPNSIFTCYYNHYYCYGVLAASSSKKSNAKLHDYMSHLGIGYYIDYQYIADSPDQVAFLNRYGIKVKTLLVTVPTQGAYHVEVYKLK